MDVFDENIKQRMMEETRELSLSEAQKANIQAVMSRELDKGRHRPCQQLFAKLALFWESTHEVSLAPVAVACVLLVVAGAGVLREIPSQSSYEPTLDAYLVSQANGGIEIVPLRDDMEVR